MNLPNQPFIFFDPRDNEFSIYDPAEDTAYSDLVAIAIPELHDLGETAHTLNLLTAPKEFNMVVSPEAFDALTAVLEAPPKVNPRLRALMSRPSRLDV